MTAAEVRRALEQIAEDARAAIDDFDAEPDEGIPSYLVENIERNAQRIRFEYK